MLGAQHHAVRWSALVVCLQTLQRAHAVCPVTVLGCAVVPACACHTVSAGLDGGSLHLEYAVC